MVSLNPFDSFCKELVWHREKYEQNFQKALASAQSAEDIDTLRSNIVSPLKHNVNKMRIIVLILALFTVSLYCSKFSYFLATFENDPG